MTYCFDLDGTLCSTENGNYESSIPIQDRIEKVNALFDSGNIIIIDTARGSVTRRDWASLTEKQLKEWGLKYTTLRVGVKFHADEYIDDKGKNDLDFF